MTELDLTPASPDDSASNGRSLRNIVVVGVFVAVLGFVLYQAVSSASVYFYNVDEAVAQRDEIGDKTIRLQGVVTSEPATDASGRITFVVTYNGVDATVYHVGAEPTDLFERDVPVVAEGHWIDEVFQSDQLLIKHSESYVAENPDRIDEDVEAKLDVEQ